MKLQDWIERKLVRCRTPSITKGRIYELTSKGKCLRSTFIRYLNSDQVMSILEDAKSTKEYLNPPKDMDMNKYAKVVGSPCLKVPLLDILSDKWERVVDEYIGRGMKKRLVPGIYTYVKDKNLSVNWSNLIDCLKEMVDIDVVKVKRKRGRKNYFRLTKDGIIIRDWIHKIRILELNL